MRTFLNQGLIFAKRHLEDLKHYYKSVFDFHDKDKDGLINLEEFTNLIVSLDKKVK